MTKPGLDLYKEQQYDITYRLSKLMAMARNRAKTKNLDFNLDIEFLQLLFEEQGGLCAVSNREFDLSPYGVKHVAHPNAPSIDRIVPALGYTKGNVRLICYQVNCAIGAYGLEAFLQLCKECA